jgi:hypothetical protein
MSRRTKFLMVAIPVACVLLAFAIPNFIHAPKSAAMSAYTNSARLVKEWKSKLETGSTASFRTGGFSHMESYVELLLQSRNESAAVIVATLEMPRVLTLQRKAGRTVMIIRLGRAVTEVEETKIREFFGRRGMSVSKEVPGTSPPNDGAAPGFEVQLEGDSKTIAPLCVSVFTDLYGATDEKGSSFTFFGL